MVDVVTRAVKGTPLTHDEMDANLTGLAGAVNKPSIYAAQVLADAPVAYWRFNDEYSSTSYADSSGNGYDMSTTTSHLLPVMGGLRGDSDRGVYTIGGSSGAYAKVPDALRTAFPTSNNLTVECLINIQNKVSTSYASIFCLGTTAESNIGHVRLCAQSASAWNPYFQVVDAANVAITATCPIELPFYTWFHIAGTYDGATIKFYLNGLLVASTAGAITVPITKRPYGDFMKAPWSADVPASCFVDEFALYNSCLSASRIAEHYHYAMGVRV